MIVDFHTHVFPSFMRKRREDFFSREPGFESIYGSSKARLVGVRELLNNMDDEEVDRSVVFGFPWNNTENFRRHNDYIIDAVKQHPDRLVGFCCFSPSAPRIAREVERCLEEGLSGVGELAVYNSGLSEELRASLKEVMQICARIDVPLLLHTNEPVGHQYPGKAPMTLAQIYSFLKDYPSNRIVLAHWGGGIFFYALMKKEVREILGNVWFDTAASPFLYSPEIYRLAGKLVGFDKILFGSDYPLIKPHRYINEMTSSGIPAKSAKQIKGLNAARLLGLK